MDLKSLLDYQKKDAELIKLEKQLSNNENKKIFSQMISVVKDAQNKSSALEKQAGDLLKEYQELKNTYENNIKSANIIVNKKLETASDSDLDPIEEIAAKKHEIISETEVFSLNYTCPCSEINEISEYLKQQLVFLNLWYNQ